MPSSVLICPCSEGLIVKPLRAAKKGFQKPSQSDLKNCVSIRSRQPSGRRRSHPLESQSLRIGVSTAKVSLTAPLHHSVWNTLSEHQRLLRITSNVSSSKELREVGSSVPPPFRKSFARRTAISAGALLALGVAAGVVAASAMAAASRGDRPQASRATSLGMQKFVKVSSNVSSFYNTCPTLFQWLHTRLSSGY